MKFLIKLLMIGFSSLSLYFFLSSFFMFSKIQGPSMEPTFFHGDRVFSEKFSIHFLLLSRGDIIAFSDVRTEGEPHLVKRVIGFPKETVYYGVEDYIFIKDINGTFHQLGSDFSLMPTNFNGAASSTYLGPEDYFVLGDNRIVSRDSRRFGTVQPHEMLGKIWFKF